MAVTACLTALGLPLHRAAAQGVSLSPQRVILSGRGRSAEVLLINRGREPETYRIFLVNKRMREDGTLENVEASGAEGHFADRMIRFAPRQVTVPVGGTQTVRLLVRRPRDLPPGEYRSHLTFRSVPPPSAGRDVQTLDLKENEVAVQMIRIFEISIPIIVRQGDTELSAELTDLTLEPADAEGLPSLHLRLHRGGTRSLYGDFTVRYRAAEGAEAVELLSSQRTVLYVPTESRTVTLPLPGANGELAQGGRLEVTLHEAPEAGGALLARTTYALP